MCSCSQLSPRYDVLVKLKSPQHSKHFSPVCTTVLANGHHKLSQDDSPQVYKHTSWMLQLLSLCGKQSIANGCNRLVQSICCMMQRFSYSTKGWHWARGLSMSARKDSTRDTPVQPATPPARPRPARGSRATVSLWKVYMRGTGKPARGMDVVEDKAELASLLEAEKSRRRLLEQRFSTAEAEADKLRYTPPNHNCLLLCQ